jgi:L-ascorbate metabolism protein UlaG (beta-lactamase superfamily)
MALDITYLGHSGFLFSDGATTVAVDPFLTDNPVAMMTASQVRCQYVALTHGHFDHAADAAAIAKANDAAVIACFELTSHLEKEGCRTTPGNPGGQIAFDFGWVAFTQAFHSNSYNGQYAGMPCGLVLHIGGVTVYHCGDTALFSDMGLIGELYRPDIACIPIGDTYTMGPRLGARAAEFIKPKVAIPIHYKTWPVLAQSAAEFKPQGVQVREMKSGETWRYS